MKEVDETINEVCVWINAQLNVTNTMNCEDLSKMVTALAELVSAREQNFM